MTLEEVKTTARIMNSDFDDIIPGLIKAAREAAEKFQGIYYMTQTWEQSYDYFPSMPMEFKKVPFQSLVSIKLVDENSVETTVDTNDFIVSSRSNKIAFKPGKTWPQITLQEFDSVIFQYKVGCIDASKVSESVKLAIKVFVSYFIDNPDAPIDEPPAAFYNLLWPDREVPV